jgi:hypothetical protein
VAKLQIVFDNIFKQQVWQGLRNKVVDKTCPFCGVIITGKNFAGAMFIGDEFRAFDGKLSCLIELSDEMRSLEDEEV